MAIEPQTHDAILATVSHLPHVLANVLVSQAADALDAGGERLPATGPSFRDATRVAGAPSGIWTDIYISNRDALAGEIDAIIDRLSEFRDALESADPARISAWNEAAAAPEAVARGAARRAALCSSCAPRCPIGPGVVAELALEWGGPASTSPTWRCTRPPT